MMVWTRLTLQHYHSLKRSISFRQCSSWNSDTQYFKVYILFVHNTTCQIGRCTRCPNIFSAEKSESCILLLELYLLVSYLLLDISSYDVEKKWSSESENTQIPQTENLPKRFLNCKQQSVFTLRIFPLKITKLWRKEALRTVVSILMNLISSHDAFYNVEKPSKIWKWLCLFQQ